jgi:hypothetical protein
MRKLDKLGVISLVLESEKHSAIRKGMCQIQVFSACRFSSTKQNTLSPLLGWGRFPESRKGSSPDTGMQVYLSESECEKACCVRPESRTGVKSVRW